MTSAYTSDDVVAAFAECGVREGDLLHLHSALFPLGPLDGVANKDVPAAILASIGRVLGENGTLTVPAAFEDFARFGTPYDRRTSPVDRAQGIFSQHVTNEPTAVRTYAPLCGVAAVGAAASDICGRRTASAMGSDSAWDRLHARDAKLGWLGVAPHLAFTFSLLIQFRYGVPHLYNKVYQTPLLDGGQPVDLLATCCVRYLDARFRISEDCTRFEARLREEGLLREAKVGRGTLYVLESAQQVFDLGTEALKSDLFYFCKEVPSFVQGEIPMDGATGSYVPDDRRFGGAKK